MQLNEVGAKAGYLWFRQGIWLFRRNPLALLMLFFTYFFLMLMLAYIPVAGVLLRVLLVPTVSVGFMIACRDTIVGKPVLPTTLVAGLHAYGPNIARQLLTMGLMYLVAVAVLLGLSALCDGGILFNLLVFDGNVSETELENSNESLTLAVMAAAYIPVMMTFWFGPILTAWHEIPPHKALFFSFIAFWRNRTAFALYCLIWGAAIFGSSTILLTVLMALGLSPSAMTTVMVPFCLVATTALYCSFYATYRGCFTLPDATLAVAAGKPPAVD